MKISHGWLSEFVDLDPTEWTSDRIAEVLTDLGLEVEHVDDQARALRRFVVGYVVSATPHPKADKLTVCTVDAGEPEHRTICCGAKNVAAGQYVPVALDGAIVPNGGFEIGKRTLRGVESNGMICSSSELGLDEDHDGIMVLSDSYPPGTELAVALGLTDVVYDVFNTPNRADCNSHIGVARDLAAYIAVQSSGQRAASSDKRATSYELRATISEHPVTTGFVDPDLAPRYALQRIRNVKVVPSPDWMQQRLLAVGLRPRNILVDVTNYVNMELGQPLHAFDYNKLRGGGIEVKTMGAPFTFTTLDDKQRQLSGSELMICDLEGPVAIAGVMGGNNSEIDDTTTDIVLESAFFNPTSIRRTAKALGMNTDASYRFERGVDIGNVIGAMNRATQLILEYAGGEAAELIDLYPSPLQPAPIRVRYERMRSINGIDVSDATIRRMCEAIGCSVRELDATACEVVPPTWRVDLGAEIDLAEEVMRLHGINQVPVAEYGRLNMTGKTLHPSVQAAGGSDRLQRRRDLRRMLAARGYSDCVTSVLTSPELASAGGAAPAHLKNALGVEFSALRTSILPGLLAAASRNLRHGVDTVRLSDIGSVFDLDATAELGVRQRETLCLLVTGDRETHWSLPQRALDLYDLLGDVGIVASVATEPRPDGLPGMWTPNLVELRQGDRVVGLAGQLDPQLAAAFDVERAVYAAEIDLRLVSQTTARYQPVGQYPSVRRDLAMIVDEAVTAAAIIDSIASAAPGTFRGAEVFDVYRHDQHVGVGKKSVAVAMRFQHDERTLVDDEVDASVAEIIRALHRDVAARVRGAESTVEERDS